MNKLMSKALAHKDTKQVIYDVYRTGRHYVRRNQTPIRYMGRDANGNKVVLTPTEFKAYYPAIEVGKVEVNEDVGLQNTIVAAEQKTKLHAMVTIETRAIDDSMDYPPAQITVKKKGIVV